MKKEVEVKINKTEKQTRYFCDLCEKELYVGDVESSCYVCYQDVCSDCSILTDDMKTEEVYTDYPLRICKHCWNDLKEFRTELNELLEDFESKKTALYTKWKEESLKSLKE